MCARGFEDILANAFADAVKAHEHDIETFIEELLARQRRSVGKGSKTGVNAGGHGLAHMHRDPKVTPRAEDFRRDSVTVSKTRSLVEGVKDRKDCGATIGKQFDDAKNECLGAFNKIVELAKAQHVKFFDADFYFDQRVNLYPEGSPTDCTVAEPERCMRLSDMYPNVPLRCNGAACDDILQGQIGDCYFIGAVSSLAACDKAALERLIVAHDISVGVYGVLFFKSGGWEWVLVDDIVPIITIGAVPCPLYAKSSGQEPELWPMILEKAYAKMHHNWDCIDGGWPREALGDLTGGLERHIDLRIQDREITFEQYQGFVADPLVVCSCMRGDDIKSEGFGLYHGHAYSVIAARKTSDGCCFLRVRNPWGNSAEWTGRYSDKSPEWKSKPKHHEELKPEMKADGAFWMEWCDFRTYFSKNDLVKRLPDNWHCVSFYEESSKIQPYIIHVQDVKTRIILSVGQEDTKMCNPKAGISHARQADTYARLTYTFQPLIGLPSNEDELAAVSKSRTETQRGRTTARSIDVELDLEPGFYCFLPSIVSRQAVGIFVRCFASPMARTSVHRLNEGPNKRLFVGSDVPKVDLIPMSNLLLGVQQQLVEAQTEIARLNAIVQQQQQTISAAAQQTPAVYKSPSVSPLQRVGFNDSQRLTSGLRQIFDEADPTKSGQIDFARAVNGIRILVTLGAGFDGQFRQLLKTKNLESSGGLTYEQFSDMAVSLVTSWQVLQ